MHRLENNKQKLIKIQIKLELDNIGFLWSKDSVSNATYILSWLLVFCMVLHTVSCLCASQRVLSYLCHGIYLLLMSPLFISKERRLTLLHLFWLIGQIVCLVSYMLCQKSKQRWDCMFNCMIIRKLIILIKDRRLLSIITGLS